VERPIGLDLVAYALVQLLLSMSITRLARPRGFVPAVAIERRESRERLEGPPVSMVVWSHEQRTSTDDVIVDMSLLPNAREGDVAELRTLEGKRRKLFFVVKKLSNDIDKSMANVQVSSSSIAKISSESE
jgi:hypothetical protein